MERDLFGETNGSSASIRARVALETPLALVELLKHNNNTRTHTSLHLNCIDCTSMAKRLPRGYPGVSPPLILLPHPLQNFLYDERRGCKSERIRVRCVYMCTSCRESCSFDMRASSEPSAICVCFMRCVCTISTIVI